MKKLLENKNIQLIFSLCIVIIFYFIVLHIGDIFGGISSFFGILKPLIYGLFIAYIIHPLVDIFEIKVLKDIKNKNTKRNLSIFLTFIIIISLIILVIGLIVPELLKSIKTLITNFPGYLEYIEQYALKYIPENTIDQFKDNITNILNNNLLPQVNNAIANLGTGIVSAFSNFLTIIIGMVFAAYILANTDKLYAGNKKFLNIFMKEERVDKFIKYLDHIDDIFVHFIIGKVCDSSIVMISTLIFLLIARYPYPLLIAVIIGLTDLIPYFGPYIGTIPSFVLILLIDPIKALIFILFIILLQQVDANFITPRIQSSVTGLPSFWVLFAITLFGGLFGVIGLLIGVPCFTVIYEIVRDLVNNILKSKNKETDLSYYEEDNRVSRILYKLNPFNKRNDQNE